MEKPIRRATIVFIFITCILDLLALGIIIPVLPKLVQNFTDGDAGRAAEYIGLFSTVWAAMHFVASPVLGTISDQYGRRPVILLSCLGMGIDYIFMAMAPTLGWLFVGRVISGLTAANITVAGAYISDVTPPERRAQGFGMIGMAFGIGFIVGPALGGLLGTYDPRLPFWAAAVLSLLNTCYGAFVLPESLAPENRTPFSWKKANPIGSLNLLLSHKSLFRLSMISFINTVAHVVLPSVFVIYAGYRYNWNERDVGLTLATVGVFNGIVQGGLIGWIIKKIGEQRALMLGLVMGGAGFVTMGVAPNGFWFWFGVPFLALWGVAGAVIQGMMTEHAAANEQGQLQGAVGSMRGIAELVGPSMFTLTFAQAIASGRNVPGAPFYLAAGMIAVATALSLRRS